MRLQKSVYWKYYDASHEEKMVNKISSSLKGKIFPCQEYFEGVFNYKANVYKTLKRFQFDQIVFLTTQSYFQTRTFSHIFPLSTLPIGMCKLLLSFWLISVLLLLKYCFINSGSACIFFLIVVNYFQ